MDDRLKDALPCPFCGSKFLIITDWYDEEGQYDAVACDVCKAEAPLSAWNRRRLPEIPSIPALLKKQAS